MVLEKNLNRKSNNQTILEIRFLIIEKTSYDFFKIRLTYKNKNDNIKKNEVQQIRWSDEYSQHTLALNITEYHIISKFHIRDI